MPEKDKQRYLETAVRDVTAALDFYLRHQNGGRPFILASHSQGSNVLQLILLRHPERIDRTKLVAAYMPGWTFTDADIARIGIPLSSGPDATGVLAVWNTIGPGGSSPTLGPGARCVNPLSWTTDHKEYPASMNIAARISRTGAKPLVVPHFTAARITDSGALEIPAPRPEIASQLNMSLGAGCYHRYDYDFFYDNVAANVKARCAAYLARHN